MPTGRSIRQTILDHQTYGQRDDAVGILTLRRSQIGHVRVKITLALAAVVLRILQVDLSWSSREQVPNVMKLAVHAPFAIATFRAVRAGTSAIVAAAIEHLGLGQIFNARNSFRAI